MAQPATFEELLAQVEKPSRYLGNEVNAVRKDLSRIALKVGLAYPDFYEVGMSNTGLHILYYLLNERPEIACERVFLPGHDLEAILRDSSQPLLTLESRIPVRELDIFGIQLPHELAYTNIVKLIRLARVPLWAAARKDDDPIVLGGGPGAFGPEPVAPFYDAILLGDAEEALLRICETVRELKSRVPRLALLRALADIEGVYVPRFFDVRYRQDGTIDAIVPLSARETVRKAVVLDLETAFYPKTAIVPFADTVHNRLGVEVMRGCTVGCRFCQAGMIYRPLRERSPKKILDLAKCGMGATGFEDVSLLSLDTGDYTLIDPLAKALLDQTQEKRVAVSLPSLRAGSLTDDTIREIKRVRMTGFTIAPEAGTQRLRDVINKNISDEEIFETTERVASQGWTSIKFYFMLGFPTERAEDLDGICDLALKARRIARRFEKAFDVTVSLGTLVPKPHTPFQWDAQLATDEALRRCRHVVDRLRPYHLAVKYWDPKSSWLEGVLSRGDRRLAPVIAAAEAAGCGFDSWTEHYRMDIWQRIFREHSVDPAFYLRKRPYKEVLPWDHLDARVTKGFLEADRKKIDRAERLATPGGAEGGHSPPSVTTFDCRDDLCAGCSACFEGDIRNRLAKYGDDPMGDGRRLPVALTERVAGGHELGRKIEGVLRPRTPSVRNQAAKAGEDAARAILRRRARPEKPSERRWHTTPGAPGIAGPAPAFFPENVVKESEASRDDGERKPPEETGRALTAQEKRGLRHEGGAVPHRYRMKYRKLGSLRWLSHLELIKVVYRALTRAELPLRFSEGFHPKPKVSFGPPLAVGVESDDEELDFFLDEPRDEAKLLESLQGVFPVEAGLQPLAIEAVSPSRPSLQAERLGARYEVDLAPLGLLPGSLEQARRQFEASGELLLSQERHGAERTVDLRVVVSEVEADGQRLRFSLRSDVATAKPDEVVATLLRLAPEVVRRGRYRVVSAIRRPAPAPLLGSAP